MTRQSADRITTEAALDAGARLIAELVDGLIKTPEGRGEAVSSLIVGIAQAHDLAEAEIMRRAVEMMRERGWVS